LTTAATIPRIKKSKVGLVRFELRIAKSIACYFAAKVAIES
jgi:hypothetical protein